MAARAFSIARRKLCFWCCGGVSFVPVWTVSRVLSITDPMSTGYPKRLNTLPPPFVVDYAPYANELLAGSAVAVSRNCAGNWDQYYRNNTTRGYKDRHYILREFTELADALFATKECRRVGEKVARPERTGSEAASPHADTVELLEIGCGVGNAVLPLLREHPSLQVYAVDISAVAIGLLLQTVRDESTHNEASAGPIRSLADRCVAVAHDVASAPVPASVLPPSGTVSFATLIFVLCSVRAPDRARFVRHAAACIKPGGVLFFRDYCDGDLAQARFVAAAQHTGSRTPAITESGTFARTNGTLSHFFTVEEVETLFSDGGFKAVDVSLVERTVINRKRAAAGDGDEVCTSALPEGHMPRRWIQARFSRL